MADSFGHITSVVITLTQPAVERFEIAPASVPFYSGKHRDLHVGLVLAEGIAKQPPERPMSCDTKLPRSSASKKWRWSCWVMNEGRFG